MAIPAIVPGDVLLLLLLLLWLLLLFRLAYPAELEDATAPDEYDEKLESEAVLFLVAVVVWQVSLRVTNLPCDNITAVAPESRTCACRVATHC